MPLIFRNILFQNSDKIRFSSDSISRNFDDTVNNLEISAAAQYHDKDYSKDVFIKDIYC